MIVDTSAVVAVARGEDTSPHLERLLHANPYSLISAASYVELCLVLQPDHTPRSIDRLLEELDITPVPLTVNQARIAALAYREYGKGSGSPARLNYGDTFSYALAKDTGQPLLFVGEDFTRTDVAAALSG